MMQFQGIKMEFSLWILLRNALKEIRIVLIVPLPLLTNKVKENFFPEQLPTIKEMEKALVNEVLSRVKKNQTIAAQMLGPTRSTLNKRLNRALK